MWAWILMGALVVVTAVAALRRRQHSKHATAELGDPLNPRRHVGEWRGGFHEDDFGNYG